MRATWTYEVPPAGSDATGLEDYQVETSDGEPSGKVIAVLDREGEQYVVFDAGTPPVASERRAVPWHLVNAVDHDTLTVTLRLAAGELSEALELDPAKAVEGGRADAVRVTRLPSELMPTTAPGTGGPTDRASYASAVALFAAGLIALLALALAASGADDFTWEFALFAIPVMLILAAAAVAYRTFRQPYER